MLYVSALVGVIINVILQNARCNNKDVDTYILLLRIIYNLMHRVAGGRYWWKHVGDFLSKMYLKLTHVSWWYSLLCST